VRDLLLELAVADLYRAKWSDAVHEEWIGAVLRDRSDLTRARLERTRDLMNAHVRDALVKNFEPLIDILDLPDPADRRSHRTGPSPPVGRHSLRGIHL